MAHLFYYLVLKPFSWLPLWITHRFSSFLAWLFFSVTGYRKKVVLHNLALAFPDKTQSERNQIAKQFYRSLTDTLVESIRFFSISEKEALRRCRVTNPEALQAYADKGQSVIFVGAHTTNFEIAALTLGALLKPHRAMGIYSPLSNEKLDNLIFGNRRRMGTILVSRRKVQEWFATEHDFLTADIFVADQSPSNAEPTKLHWTTFMTQTTGFVAGPERYAVRYDRPILYMYLRRSRRGHYEITLRELFKEPMKTAPGEITETYVRTLEQELLERPSSWLWTHRRWKRGVPDSVQEQWPPEQGYLPPVYDREQIA
ncbi:MAG: hypothetical protein AAF433_13430 [Bacteroidota bacterium]